LRKIDPRVPEFAKGQNPVVDPIRWKDQQRRIADKFDDLTAAPSCDIADKFVILGQDRK